LSSIELAVGGGGFAFTRLDCSNKELTHLGNKVEDYTQLRHVVLSHNKFSDVAAVTKLPHLLSLQIDNNEVTSLDCMQDAALSWCQRLDLSANKLKALPSLGALVHLRFATFAGNAIESLEGFGDHPALEELNLQDNQLKGLQGLGVLAGLKKLNVMSNQITTLEGLDTPCLTHLNASKNQLQSLAHIAGAPEIEELDIRDNQFNSEDIQLPEMRRLGNDTPVLRNLLVSGNPLADAFSETLKVEMLVCAPQLHRVEEELIVDEDREAAHVREQEIEVEAARIAAERAAAEAEARAQAEAEAAGEEEAS
jgi:Leucine-rich repeat (LRR) protein